MLRLVLKESEALDAANSRLGTKLAESEALREALRLYQARPAEFDLTK